MASHSTFPIRTLAAVIGAMTIHGVALTPAALAQTRPQPAPRSPSLTQVHKSAPKWAIGFDFGAAFGVNTPGGSAVGPQPVGASFTTVNGRPSRAISSWFFGDGATLFNQVQSQFAAVYGVQIPTIAPLDSVLFSPAAHSSGIVPSFAIRATRQITPRYAVEFAYEHRGNAVDLTDAAQSAVNASLSSFQASFNGLIGTIPQHDVNVTTSTDSAKSGGGQNALTAEAVISLVKHTRLGIDALAGGGIVFNGDAELDVTVTGAYAFTIFGTFPINETDKVIMHFVDSGKSALGSLGGRLTYAVAPRQGVRIDFRLLMSDSGFKTSVDTQPTVRRVSPGSVLPSETTPSLQFSTATGTPTSLSGPALRTLSTFVGSGLDMRLQVSAGYFFRF